MLQSSRSEKCESFKTDDTLQRRTHPRFASLCVSVKASLTASQKTRREAFLFPQIVFDRDVATRNEGLPNPCEVQLSRAGESKHENDKTFIGNYGCWYYIYDWMRKH